MSIGSKLSKGSSYFFTFGFITGKAQYLPLPVVVPILNLLSLSFYLIGYILWFISSHFHPKHPNKQDEWYGFAQFKEQYLYAATLGIIATFTSACAIAFPPLLIPAAWLFLISSTVWTTGEYHKLNNPPDHDPNYSHSGQKSYVSYAIIMSTTGLVTAISTTLTIVFPPVAVPVLILSTITCLGLGILAAERWLDYNFGDHKKENSSGHSYKQMGQSLGATLPSQLKPDTSPAPFHSTILLKTQVPSSADPTDESTLSIHSCTQP